MKQGRFDFDSSFRFNTQYREIYRKNNSHESFIAVPGAGYILMKEYGMPFEFEKNAATPDNIWETAYLLSNYTETEKARNPVKNGFTLSPGLSPISFVRNRGDFNLFYFPAISRDSTWSGILEMEQHADLNNPDLSYLLIPAGKKLHIIYNNFDGYSDALANTTTLDIHGQSTDDPIVFWKMDKMLNFQRAHRFSADEVAVPYLNNNLNGFAVIRLK